MDLIQKDCDEENGGRPGPADCHSGPVKMDDIDDPAKATTIAPSPSKAHNDPEGTLVKWADYARQKIRRVANIVVHPLTTDGVKRIFQESALSQITPSGDKNITVMYDTKLSGSASSRAHIRTVNLREAHCKSGVRGIITAMRDGHQIPSNTVFFMLDGMVHGHEAKLMQAFCENDAKVLPRAKKTMYITCSEA